MILNGQAASAAVPLEAATRVAEYLMEVGLGDTGAAS